MSEIKGFLGRRWLPPESVAARERWSMAHPFRIGLIFALDGGVPFGLVLALVTILNRELNRDSAFIALGLLALPCILIGTFVGVAFYLARRRSERRESTE